MKYYVIFAFVLFTLTVESLQAQVKCNIPCWQQSFPYTFCDKNGNEKVGCSTDPNNDPQGTPVKSFIPGCVTIINESTIDTLWQPRTAVPIEDCGSTSEPYPDPVPLDRQTFFEDYVSFLLTDDSIWQPAWLYSPDDFGGDTAAYELWNEQWSLDSATFVSGDVQETSPYDPNDPLQYSVIHSAGQQDYYYLWYSYASANSEYENEVAADSTWEVCDSTFRAQDADGTDVPYVQPWNDAQAQSDAQNALNNWLSVCQPPIQPDGPNCCIHIILDPNTSDWGTDAKDQLGTNVDANGRPAVIPCTESTCPDLNRMIRVNTSPAFLYRSNDPKNWYSDPSYKLHASPKQMWYTTPTGLPNTYEGGGSYEDVSFFELMEHEIGHYLGLLHPEWGPSNTADYSCPNCYTANPYILPGDTEINPSGYWTVMAQQLIFPGDTSNYLTSEDSCQFKKLYCPQDLSVKLGESSGGSSPEIFPNPTTGACQLQYELLDRAFVQVTIYDVRGNQMRLVSSGYEEAGTRIISLGTESLPSGHYVCRIRVGETVTYLNLVVEK